MLPARLREAISVLRELPRDARREWWSAKCRRLLGTDLLELPAELGVEPHITFVCHGNIYRSPAAQLTFLREAERRGLRFGSVASAGLRARDGQPSPDDAVRVAEHYGLPLHLHRSRFLTDEVIAESDLLVIMDRRNEALLALRSRGALQKTVFLGAFDPSGDDPTILDPYGRGPEAVAASFVRIDRSVAGLLDALAGRSPRARSGSRATLIARGKNLVRTSLTAPPFQWLWAGRRRQAASIVMLHRFAHPDRGVSGHNVAELAENLEFLRKNDFHICSLAELIERYRNGLPPRPNTIVFTVDDGYADFVEIGAPLFAQYDVPATTFLITGFVDGAGWIWYDKLRYCALQHPALQVEVPIGDQLMPLAWRNAGERRIALRRFIRRLHAVPAATVEATVSAFPGLLGVSVPEMPVARFAPLTWADVRTLERRGMRFGPHTHTHPILSQVDAVRSRDEVVRSWSRLCAEAAEPTAVFCYPSGMPGDYTAREEGTVREAGLEAAVVAFGGRVSPSHFRRNAFALPRIAYEASPASFRWQLAGAGRLTAGTEG